MSNSQVCVGLVNHGAGDIIKPPCNPLLINEDRTRPPRTEVCEAHWDRVKVKVPVYKMGLCEPCFRGMKIGKTPVRAQHLTPARSFAPIPCAHCGHMFTPHHFQQMFCRSACRLALHSKLQTERLQAARGPINRKCVVCDAEFKPLSGPQLTCSEDCSKQRNRQQNRDRKKDRRGIVRL